jgi:peptidyl-prolyl cis-trans isomerase A (cyclophilin A)
MKMLKFGKMLMQVSIAMALAVSIAAAQSQTAAKPPAKPAPKPAAKPAATQHPAAAAYDHALLNPALLHARAPAEYDVKMTTTKGDVIIHVTRAWAPLGADRVYNLVAHHYFDNASFFRVIKGFMVQFGLSAYPAVNNAWSNADIKDDPKNSQSNVRGFVTFATAGPNTRTTQVFINFADNSQLDSQGFVPFGQVTQGMDVVDQIYSVYGEGAPDGHGPSQEAVATKGRPYLDANFPKLDHIVTATIVGGVAAPAHPATAPAHPAATHPAAAPSH